MVWPVVGAIASEWLGSEFQGQHNAREASKNRAFQERMSSTAYTRAAHDLRTAGLNRVLALGNPSSTPAGASSSIDKPDFAGAATRASSASQMIKLQKAEESLVGQKENESRSSEALNKAMELTQGTQQMLNTANATSAIEQSKLLQEQARKVRIEADRTETWNPVYRGINDVLESLDNWIRSGSRKGGDGPLKSVLHELETGEGVKRVWKNFTSKPKPNANVTFESQKWPKFKRGGK